MKLGPNEQKLVEQALPMVAALARRTHRRFPEVPVDDFVSLGHEAAVEAARTFDASRGVPFELFAVKRISGSMVRDATKEHFGRIHVIVRNALSENAEPPPADLPLDQALEDSPEKARARAVSWIRREAAAAFVATMEVSSVEVQGGEDDVTVREAYRRGQEALAEALRGLADSERHFIERHYRQGATFDEIAVELGVVKRTVTRMHDRIKIHLAERLRAAGVTRAPAVVEGT